MSRPEYSKAGERIDVALILIATCALSYALQDRLSVANGFGWDGAEYAKIADEVHAHHQIPFHADAPFCFRILVPWLVGRFFGGTLTGFFIINETAAILSAFLLLEWLRPQLTSLVRLLAVFAYILAWNGPVRFTFWAPSELVDAPFMAFILGALLCARSKRYVLLGMIVFCGSLNRETMMLVPAILLPAAIIDGDDETVVVMIAVGFIAMSAIGITHFIVQSDSHYGAFGTALWWAYKKPAPAWLHGAFIAYGPMLALVFARFRMSIWYLKRHKELAFWLAYAAILAWIGGSDTERFFLWAFPVVLALAGRAFMTMDTTRVAAPICVLVVAQLVSERIFTTIPDYAPEVTERAWPILTPILATHSTLLTSNSPDMKMTALALIEYVVLCSALVLWIRHLETKVA